MQRRGRARAVGRAVLLGWLLAGCADLDGRDDAGLSGPPEYIFAGQTGSLVPSCGLAPLTQGQLAVPQGDTLAVLYTSGCPELSVAALSVVGADARGVPVRLEPLGEPDVYLVRVDESLAAGDYQLELPERASSTLSVGDAEASLPVSLGSISALPQSSPCGSDVSFEWALDADVLAHAPLLRVWVRIDGGREQLWVDYGALSVDAGTGVAELRLPRCGTFLCLSDGSHRLEMRAEVAGEGAQPEPLEASFVLSCGEPATTSAQAADTSSSEASCSLGASTRPKPSDLALLGAALLSSRWRRRRRVLSTERSS